MNRNLKLTAVATLAFGMTAGFASVAFAQEAQAQGQVGMTLPGTTPAAAYAGNSDHDRVVGTLAVGYLGQQGMNVGLINPITAPVVGVRYWLQEMIGIDAGLGVAIVDQGDDEPSGNAFILHGGVPLSLADEGHFSFQIVPELNVGFGSSTLEAPGGDTDGSGFLLNVGARAGAEIHFGFIGVPQLSLQGSVGLRFETNSWKTEVGGVEAEDNFTRFGTTLQDNPWNIFTSNVAAFYYF